MRKRSLITRNLLVSVMLGGLAACATTPSTITHENPQKTHQSQHAAVAPTSGAIYNAGGYRPLFEDYRARMVGDTLTIVISESTSAGKDGSGSASHTGSSSYSAPQIFGLPSATLNKLGLSAEGESEYENEASVSSSNSFKGTINAIVTDVYPNGNLLVSGEKQIALDKGAEFIRVSGIVNPRDIKAGNTVLSSQVADARVEYRTNTRIDAADVMTHLARFFLSVMPL